MAIPILEVIKISCPDSLKGVINRFIIFFAIVMISCVLETSVMIITNSSPLKRATVS